MLDRAREGLEDVMSNAERFSPPVPDVLHEGSKKNYNSELYRDS